MVSLHWTFASVSAWACFGEDRKGNWDGSKAKGVRATYQLPQPAKPTLSKDMHPLESKPVSYLQDNLRKVPSTVLAIMMKNTQIWSLKPTKILYQVNRCLHCFIIDVCEMPTVRGLLCLFWQRIPFELMPEINNLALYHSNWHHLPTIYAGNPLHGTLFMEECTQKVMVIMSWVTTSGGHKFLKLYAKLPQIMVKIFLTQNIL